MAVVGGALALSGVVGNSITIGVIAVSYTHLTYTAGEEKDFRILLEADFLVNAYEDGMTAEQCKTCLLYTSRCV